MNKNNSNPNEKKGISIVPFLLLIIAILGFYVYKSTTDHKSELLSLVQSCSPANTTDEVKLDVNSTLVNSLYKKVETNLREDLAQPEFNDNMKLYLAARQVLERDKYESHCNFFTDNIMEPYKCVETLESKPKAFKEDVLKLELKKLFGEKTEIPLGNIQLGTSCIGGYAYIKERGEFVQGKCGSQNATTFSVDKKLVEATSTGSKIVLKEDVKYHGNEKMDVPDYLKSGYYYYTFILDINYNYVLTNKTYESKH